MTEFFLFLAFAAVFAFFMFMVCMLACCFALGRMHVWLKGKAEVFGDNEGLREELADIRGHIIGQNNDRILNRPEVSKTG